MKTKIGPCVYWDEIATLRERQEQQKHEKGEEIMGNDDHHFRNNSFFCTFNEVTFCVNQIHTKAVVH